MARHTALDNVAHGDLIVAQHYASTYGDAVNQVLALPTEFEALQREYPVLFRRDPARGWYAVALLGLARDENLFLGQDGSWDARYVPAMRRRGPFLGGADGRILIDLDDPRVGVEQGEPLFLRHGGHSPYLRRIEAVLDVIRRGHAASSPLYAALDAAGLFVPAEIEIDAGDRGVHVIEGVFRIDDRRLAELDGPSLERLNRAGFLRAAMMAAASLDNVHHLIARAAR